MKLEIYDKELSIKEVHDFVSSNESKIILSDVSIKLIKESSDFFDNIYNQNESCYGLNTGFGSMINYTIEESEIIELQKRLVFSHSVGNGSCLSEFQCKLTFFLRILCLAKGNSGVKYSTISFLIELYNKGVVPIISSEGSLGASGDLSPLSHLACFFIGEGEGWYNNDKMSAKDIFSLLSLEPLILNRKEGLSLINGTSVMTALSIENYIDLSQLFSSFISLYSLCLNVFNISTSFIDTSAIKTKPHKGAIYIIHQLEKIISRWDKKENNKDKIFQEVYSIRCVPFILAPLVDSLEYYSNTILIELNSSNDNPIYLFDKKELYHGGNFHGGVLSFATDQVRHAISLISGVVDRQIEHILDIKNNIINTPFLSFNPEKGYTGFEGAQYLVTSLSSEISFRAQPYFKPHPSANSGNQDFVSFGLQSNISLSECITRLEKVLIIYAAVILQKTSLDSNYPNTHIKSIIENELNAFLPYKDSYPFRDLVSKMKEINILELMKY